MQKANLDQVQKYLGEVDYPAKKQEVIEKAKKQGAPKEVLDVLNKIPDKNFSGQTDLVQEVSRLIELNVKI